MSIDIGEATLSIMCDGKQLDAYLAKLQRALQAARDVLSEKDSAEAHNLAENVQ